MTSTVPNDGRISERTSEHADLSRRVHGAGRPDGNALVKFLGDIAVLGVAAALLLPAPTALCFVAAVVLVLGCVGSYRRRLTVSVLDDIPSLLVGVCVGAALAVAGTVVFTGSGDAAVHGVTGLARLLGVSFGALLAGRTVLYAVIRRRRRRGDGSPTLIVGTGEVAAHVARVLARRPEYGLIPVGLVASGPAADIGLPVLGPLDRLEALVHHHGIRHLIIAFDRVRDSDVADRLMAWESPGVRVLCVPRFFEVYPRAMSAGDVQGMPLVWIRRAGYLDHRRLVKRALDIVGSSVVLLLTSPLIALCMVMARREGRPAVFTQERIGCRGRPFTLYKISSMAPADPEEAATRWNINNDARLTRFGHLLRKSAVDELPQLYNVLRGDMSLVGPRPERPHFVGEFQERYRGYAHRHRVPVGLTGWAQIHGLRGDTPIADRVLLDNQYIENWSLWSDTKIILRTVTCLLRDVLS